MKTLWAVLILFSSAMVLSQTSAPAPSGTPMPADKAFVLCKQYQSQYQGMQFDALWPKLSPKLQQLLKSPADAKATMEAAYKQIGHESKVLNERILPVPGSNLMQYTRLIETDAMPMQFMVYLAVDPDGIIQGLAIRKVDNPAESKYLDYKDKAALTFPLRGEWTIYQGGRSVYDNYHAAVRDQRFAYDIIMFHPDGLAAQNGGLKPEDYFGFGQPVVADAPGKIVVALDQYDDNPIAKPLPDSPKQGNAIVIDHGNGEFSMFAHLKRGSVKVKAGDEVKAGQAIALVGNSGNSPIPHLHYHMQTTPDWFKGDGLPTTFQGLNVNGKKLASAEPVRGDVVKAE